MPKRLVCTNCLAPQPNPATGLCAACANAALPPRDRELKAKRAKREGMRGCVSCIKDEQLEELDKRLALFNNDYCDK